MGELLKIAIIDGGSWARKLNLNSASTSRLGNEIWRALAPAVEAKMKVVRRDPLEKNGERYRLNLGHTFGHVIEGATGVSHGVSVWLGLQFAIELSLEEGQLDPKNGAKLLTWIGRQRALESLKRYRVSKSTALKLLNADKKRTGENQVNFVFVNGLGRTKVKRVSVGRLLQAAKENGWLR